MKYVMYIFLLPFVMFSNTIHTELGMPKSAETLQLVERYEYTSGVKCDYGVPLWVAYNVNKDWYGDVPRWSKNFMPDSSLPQSCWIRHSDYTNSGYDRGHMVRSEKRTRTPEENRVTFLTSNIIPQLPELNQNTWLKMEYYMEKLAKDSLKEIFAYSGPIYSKFPITKYNNKVAIPDSCYMIFAVLDYGQRIEDVNEGTKIFAVVMPNNDKNVKSQDWTKFISTVENIEQQTGIDFFTSLPKILQDKLEGRITANIDMDKSKVTVYPNPTSDFINISTSDLLNNYEISIFNTYGEILMTQKINYDSNTQIDVSKLSAGMYYLKIGLDFQKFVKVN